MASAGGGLDDSLTAEPVKVVNPQFEWLVKLGYAELVCVFTRLRMSNFYLKAILKERDKADADNSGTVSIKEFFTRYGFSVLVGHPTHLARAILSCCVLMR